MRDLSMTHSTATRDYQIIRKAKDYLRQIPRALYRRKAENDEYLNNPPILVNSFPKSGTHLLFQIAKAFPNTDNFGSFVASQPSVSFKVRSNKEHLDLISKIIPGEIVRAHLFYDEEYVRALNAKNCVIFFIYRDLRDVVVSDAHYLGEINKWHRMYRYFKKLNREERILRAIIGFSDEEIPFYYPNIAERFSNFAGWLTIQDVFPVRFEEIISPDKQIILNKIAEFSLRGRKMDYSITKILNQMMINMRPEKSHTYRSGRKENWKLEFTDEHRDIMKTIAGDLLIKLGYEKDNNW